jgi:hypothetical protein
LFSSMALGWELRGGRYETCEVRGPRSEVGEF